MSSSRDALGDAGDPPVATPAAGDQSPQNLFCSGQNTPLAAPLLLLLGLLFMGTIALRWSLADPVRALALLSGIVEEIRAEPGMHYVGHVMSTLVGKLAAALPAKPTMLNPQIKINERIIPPY